MKHKLTKVTSKPSKRPGRGVGSGKGGHTAGRGTKGQGARNKIGILFEGVKNKKSLLHRLPMLPGKMKNKAQVKPVTVRIEKIASLPKGIVDEAILFEHKIVGREALKRGVKLVGSIELKNAYEVKVAATTSAVASIEKAGGKMA